MFQSGYTAHRLIKGYLVVQIRFKPDSTHDNYGSLSKLVHGIVNSNLCTKSPTLKMFSLELISTSTYEYQHSSLSLEKENLRLAMYLGKNKKKKISKIKIQDRFGSLFKEKHMPTLHKLLKKRFIFG